MKSFSLKLFSRHDSKVITQESATADVDNAVFALLSVFDMEIDYEVRDIKIEPLQKKTADLAKRVYEFVEVISW